MHNKVTWKKGMRLTTDLFNAMDASREESSRLITLLAGASRFGLFPAPVPFALSVNVAGNTLEVVSLRCHGVTRNGTLVDIDFDSNYRHTFDTRLMIPSVGDTADFLLLVRAHSGQWREIDDTRSEMVYSFELVGANTVVDDNCLPVGRIVNEYGWRLDETMYVPPCLYVSAHPKHMTQAARLRDITLGIYQKCIDSPECSQRYALSVIGLCASEIRSAMTMELDTMTPGELLSYVQQLVSSLLLGVSIQPDMSIAEPDKFRIFSAKAYNAANIYTDIEYGLGLCEEVAVKVNAICAISDEPTPPPPPRHEPKPKPKPVQQPPVEEDEYRRRRIDWDGLTI